MTQLCELPHAFRDLQPFAALWSIATMAERMQRRFDSNPEERRAFYAAAAPRAESALAYLNGFDLDGGMPADADCLFKLMLSLTEVSLTEEVFNQDIEAVHAKSNRLIAITKELDGR